MKLTVFPFLLFFLTTSFHQTFGQTVENNGWFFWSHQQKLSERWQFSSDVQVRSSDRLDYVNTLLIRPGVGYKIKDDQTVTIGYTYFGTWDKKDGQYNHENEHRIFEQFQVENSIGCIEITNRIRLEQRFLNQENDRFFAQRIRHYISAQVPLFTDPLFQKGLFLTLQNEVFLHVQGQEKSGINFFNQNRTYGGLGYRFAETVEVEGGYMFRYIVDEATMRNNIFQLTLRTSF